MNFRLRKANLKKRTKKRLLGSAYSLISVSTLSLVSTDAMSYNAYVGMRSFQATDASYNNSLYVNPAISPKAAGGGVESARTQGRGFWIMSNRSAEFSRNDGANVNETESEMLGYGVSVLMDAGAGLYLGVNHEIMSWELNSTTTNSTRNMPEIFEDASTDARVSVEITENVSVGVSVRYLNSRSEIYGNYFMSNEEKTSYDGSMFGPGAGIKGSIPLKGKLKQLDFSMAYLKPLKGKTEVYGEQFVISEPGIQEIGFSLVLNKFLVGVTSRNWVYKLDDRYFGTLYPNDDQTSVELMSLDVDKLIIFPLGHFQYGLDYVHSSSTTIRGSIAFETSEINFRPERDLPEVDSGNEVVEYKVYSASWLHNRNGITVEATFNKYSRSYSWGSGTNARSYSGDKTDYVVMLGKKI